MTFKDGRYQGTTPAEYAQTRYPVQHYFGIDTGETGQVLYPGLDLNLKHLPCFVVRRIGRYV